MTKIFVFQLAVLLFVIQGTIVSMHTTKALRTISLLKFNRNIRVNSQVSFDQWLASGGETKEERIDSLVSIEKVLKDIEKRLECHNKFLQANLELRKVEIELQIWADPMHASIRKGLLEQLKKINMPE